MPTYRMDVMIEFDARHDDDSADRAAEIVATIERAVPRAYVLWNENYEKIDTPRQPDESGS